MKKAILFASAISVLFLASCAASKNKSDETTSEKTEAAQIVDNQKDDKKMDQMKTEQKLGAVVKISTSMGDMEVLLYDETPLHRDNFLKLVDEKYYDNTLFHRIIKDFMIQGGDPDSKTAAPGAPLGMGGPGYTIEAEILPQFCHKKGALAAARQGDNVNPERRSSGSQFYIVQGKTFDLSAINAMELSMNRGVTPGKEFKYSEENVKAYTSIGGTPHLDNQYTVFAEVIKGLEVIDKIAMAQADNRSRPAQDIKMTITRLK